MKLPQINLNSLLILLIPVVMVGILSNNLLIPASFGIFWGGFVDCAGIKVFKDKWDRKRLQAALNEVKQVDFELKFDKICK